MRVSEVVLVTAIWGTLAAAFGPATGKRWQTPEQPKPTCPNCYGDRHVETNGASLLFYATSASLQLDTSASLPNCPVVPVAK